MSKHTQPPWMVRGSGTGRLCVTNRDSAYVVDRFVLPGDRPHTEHEANARLIAAAPELLAACERFATAMRKNERPELLDLIYALHEADAAIAKARGGKTE